MCICNCVLRVTEFQLFVIMIIDNSKDEENLVYLTLNNFGLLITRTVVSQ